MLHVESDFSDFKDRFEEIKGKESELSLSELYGLLKDFRERVNNRYQSIRGDWLATMDSDIRRKVKKYRELRSKVQKYVMRILKMKSKKVL